MVLVLLGFLLFPLDSLVRQSSASNDQFGFFVFLMFLVDTGLVMLFSFSGSPQPGDVDSLGSSVPPH